MSGVAPPPPRGLNSQTNMPFVPTRRSIGVQYHIEQLKVRRLHAPGEVVHVASHLRDQVCVIEQSCSPTG
jgi:hypothetical protein